MKLVKPSFEILSVMTFDGWGADCDEHYYSGALRLIEIAGRTCYKSEDRITSDTAKRFVEKLISSQHESVLEHSAMTVKFICDRGVSHELVRHRIASFSQESTRYCDYSKNGVTFIIPPWVSSVKEGIYTECVRLTEPYGDAIWFNALLSAEEDYLKLISDFKYTPQQARTVLPNSLKTEIVVTANFREWRHIFKLRCAYAAHPQMRELMQPLLTVCKQEIPVVFDDL
jgi:thymidylate synthase (FAD)